MIRAYSLLTKPRIILGNLITTTAGYALGSKGSFDLTLFLATLLGLTGIIASACVFNNYLDRALDAKMERTKDRPLVTGRLSGKQALYFASVLGLFGSLTLILYTSPLVLVISLFGFIVYVALYTLWKVRTSYATLIGSVAGAVPPVIGYAAAHQSLDLGALLLFLLLALWQMPHFFSIALYRFSDYSAASIPVLPITSGVLATKIQMLGYIMAFLLTSLLPTLFGYTGYSYLAVALLVGSAWLILCLKGFKASDSKLWAKKMFRLSLITIQALCLMMVLD